MTTPENHMEFPEDFLPEPERPAELPLTRADLLEALGVLASQIPTLDQVRMAASQAAEQAVQEQLRIAQQAAASKENEVLAEFQRKAAEIKASQANGNGNGHSPAQTAITPAQTATPTKFDSAFGMLSGILKIITESLVPMGVQMMNQSLEWQMKRVQIKLAMTDPVSMFQQMWAIDPNRARYVAMLGAPDPMLNVYPTMAAAIADRTTMAVQKGMLSGGWQPPGGPPGGPGAWVVLPNGRRLWDPQAPSGPPGIMTPPGGATLTPANPNSNPLTNPAVIDVTKLPGFGPTPPPTPATASPTIVQPNAPGATSNPSNVVSVTTSRTQSGLTSSLLNPSATPSLGSSETPKGESSSPSQSSPTTATMGAGESILLRLRH